MKLTFNSDKTKVICTYESLKEHEILKKFVVFLHNRQADVFYAVAKQSVVFNLVHRLRKKYPALKVSQDVQEFINQDFKLLPLPESFKFCTTPKKAQEV